MGSIISIPLNGPPSTISDNDKEETSKLNITQAEVNFQRKSELKMNIHPCCASVRLVVMSK